MQNVEVLMRCTRATQLMARACERSELEGDGALRAHVAGCPACAREWRLHLALLEALDRPADLPEFPDLATAVLDRIPSGTPFWWMARQWTAAAALAVLTLTVGYLLGARLLGHAESSSAITETYQAAFSDLSSDSMEHAYLDAGNLAANRRAEEERP